MQNEVLEEIKLLKKAIAILIGTHDLPASEQFSEEAIRKAAKDFKRMSTGRSEWVKEDNLDKYLGTGWGAGSFIRKEFEFNAWIKEGHSYLYNRRVLQALKLELKKRNVQLSRYMEYKKSESEFQRKLSEQKKNSRKKFPYKLPDDLRDISTSDIPKPDVELVRQDLQRLKDMFFEHQLNEYIDIYKDGYAMLKSMYPYDKYLDSMIKKVARKWCEDFNYANHALELLTKKKEVFIPVDGDDMIEL